MCFYSFAYQFLGYDIPTIQHQRVGAVPTHVCSKIFVRNAKFK